MLEILKTRGKGVARGEGVAIIWQGVGGVWDGGDGLKKKQGNMEELNSQEEYLDPKMGVPRELSS